MNTISIDILIKATLTVLVMINPISKIFVLTFLAKESSRSDMQILILKSSLIAMIILLVLSLSGDFILSQIFHVRLCSLKIAGGIVLFFVGFSAVTKGIFFEINEKSSFQDLSIVPLASPMIAGPATITTAISLSTEMGQLVSLISIFCALIINFLLMNTHRFVSSWLRKFNIMGALIRITGLVIVAMAIEMVVSGIEMVFKGLV